MSRASPRTIRLALPDVVVAVGSGASMREFECYKIGLSFASEYFDAMLSADMSERRTGRIEFPHKDPATWVEFYKLIDPAQIAMARKHPFTMENVRRLLPWFHEFDMGDFLEESGRVIEDFLRDLPDADAHDGFLFWDKNSDQDGSRLEKRRRMFSDIIELFLCSMRHDLWQAAEAAEEIIYTLLEKLDHTIDLFSTDVVKMLIPTMIAPDLSEQQQQIYLKPPEPSIIRLFFNELVEPHVRGDVGSGWRVSEEFINSHGGWCISPNLAKEPLFPLVIHSYLLNKASNPELNDSQTNSR